MHVGNSTHVVIHTVGPGRRKNMVFRFFCISIGLGIETKIKMGVTQLVSLLLIISLGRTFKHFLFAAISSSVLTLPWF